MLKWTMTATAVVGAALLISATSGIAQDAVTPPARAADTPPTTQPAGEGATSRPAIEGNPPAEGFDAERSDAKAIEIADAVMEKLGGRQAWEDTRYIEWGFFERRFYLWDKHTGDIRIRFPHQNENLVVLMNLNTKQGRAWKNRVEITNEHALKDFMDKAYSAWVNDSYWLIMPYKLKDSGVTLKYLGEFETTRGKMADVIRLSFKRVGLTPDNVYNVYVDKQSGLVTQWDWYRNFYDEEPAFRMPWMQWRRHGRIMLSADRGEGRVLSNVGVFDEVDRDLFTKPEPFDRRATVGERE